MTKSEPPSKRDSQVETDADLPGRLDDLLARQELAWRNGPRKSIEALVDELHASEDRDNALLGLICNEVVLRELAGDKPTLDEYQRRFPVLAGALRIQWEIDQLLIGSGLAAGQPNRSSRTDSILDRSSEEVDNQSLRDTHADGRAFSQNGDEESSDQIIRFGRYELVKEVGRGAIGVVYEAWDPMLKRTVALKRIRGGADADHFESERIAIEAESIAKIHHPNIVQIHDVGRRYDRPFLAMEFCSGGTLADRLKKEPLDARQCAELVAKIADGVAAAHACRIIHRDLKPGNILLASQHDLTPKVADFGLAKRLDDDHGATATGNILGTPAYMAPEQAFGGSKHVEPTADVYSIGAILYECLTGRPPFRGATIADTLEQVRQTQPVSVRLLQPQVPRDLETIVHKCLRKEPGQRFATAGELSDDLRRFLRGDAIWARRETRFETAVRIFRRYPLASSLAATAAGLLLLIAVGSLLFAQRLNILLNRSSKAERDAQIGQADALVGRAHGIRLSRRPGQRFEALSTIRQAAEIGRHLHQPAEWFEPLRDEAIAALLLPDIYVEQWHEEPAQPLAADFSDDHSQYAVSFAEVDDVVVRRLDDHSELFRIPKIAKSTYVSYMGNSRLFFRGDENSSCELWDVSGKTPRKMLRLDSGCVVFDHSHDGGLLVITDPSNIQVIDAESGRILARLPSHPFSRAACAAIHPVEPLIAIFSYFQPSVQLRNWKTGATLQELRPGEGTDDYPGYTGIEWSPDGKRLLVVNGHGQALHWYALDPKSLRLELERTDRPSTLHDSAGQVVRFNSQGDRILVAGWTNRLEIFDADVKSSIFVRGGEMLSIGSADVKLRHADKREKYAGFAVRPDHPREVGLISIADAREAKILTPGKTVNHSTTMDPGGTWLLGGITNGLMFVDATTGHSLLKWHLRNFDVYDIAFDRSGHFFVSGPTGCYRWPYRVTESVPSRLELGIPDRIHVPSGHVRIGCSDDGRTITAGAWNGFGTQEYAGCWIKPRGEPASRKVLSGVSGVCGAVSPDGRFAVTEFDSAYYVWDCQHGIKSINQLDGGYCAKFSRDGSWLLAAKKLVATDTWTSNVSFDEGSPFDLSEDGLQVLTSRQDGVTCLTDAASGKVLARLDWSDPVQVPAFSPDGERITGWTEGGIVVMDLRRIRTKLAEMGLDWDAPAYSVDNRTSQPPVKIESVQLAPELQTIDSADQLADLVDRTALARAQIEMDDPDVAFAGAKVAIDQRNFDLALEFLDRTCALLPEAITPRQWRAYLLAEMRNYARAIDDANWVHERIEEPDFRLLRAEWNYRAGLYEASIAECSKVIEQATKWTFRAYALRSACYEAMSKTEQAAADQAKFLELTSTDINSLNMVAGPMSGRDISLRHPTIALRVVRKMQSLSTEFDEYVENTIGNVLYQNDLYVEAAQWIEKCISRGPGAIDGFDLYVLAMAYHKLGKLDAAQEAHARAEAWTPAKPLDFRDRFDLRVLENESARILASHQKSTKK